MVITNGDVGRLVRLRNGDTYRIGMFMFPQSVGSYQVVLENGWTYSYTGKYNIHNEEPSGMDIVEFVDQERCTLTGSVLPDTASTEKYSDRLDLAIFIARHVTDVMVREGIHDINQAQLIFDRLTDALATESIRTLIGLLPRTGSGGMK